MKNIKIVKLGRYGLVITADNTTCGCV